MRFGLMYWVLYGTSLLVSLSLISLCIWIVLSGVRRSMKENVTTADLFKVPKVRPRGEITIWIGSMLAMLAIGLATGYGVRNHELSSSIVPYVDVAILPPSQPDMDFDIQPARMKPIPTKICDSVVDWKFGENLEDLIFEQRKGCKRVISYHRARKGEFKNAGLQTR